MTTVWVIGTLLVVAILIRVIARHPQHPGPSRASPQPYRDLDARLRLAHEESTTRTVNLQRELDAILAGRRTHEER